jgi:FtsP/CotA-like multicopper oxidase with cupredoxin domain
MKRRELLKAGLAAGGMGLLACNRGRRTSADLGSADTSTLQYLCPPDGAPPALSIASPKSRPFAAPLFVPPVKQPVPSLDPPPNPKAHQLYGEHPPKKLYAIYEQEFKWVYHPDAPYNAGSWSWGFDGITPGPTYYARYGEPVLIRRFNNLPPIGQSNAKFALPSTTSHLHNFHTASESDGYPEDWIDTGEFWDHHYAMFPANNEPTEKLSTLWYHDHRMDFTAANVYAGLAGFFLIFDEEDSGQDIGDENRGWRLPSGKYDVPLLLHDISFDHNGQVVFDIFNTDGILGDKYTVNRKIQPFFQVERRKYRFRILNGGPSRFYELYLKHGNQDVKFTVLTGDGNFQTRPIQADGLYLGVAQRYDVVIDFREYNAGDTLYLQNRLLQTNGRGPTERKIDPGPDDSIMRFDVVGGAVNDPSQVPSQFRNFPKVDLSKVRRRRTFNFDYNGGLWTTNGQVFDPERVDAKIEKGTSEIWTLRNQGKNWSHPIHSHFTEYILMEVNGRALTPVTDLPENPSVQKFTPEQIQAAANAPDVLETESIDQHHQFVPETGVIKVFKGGRRRDMAILNPSDEMVIYMNWSDFRGKYVMHCHNVVHEDHGMMIRWDVVEPGQGDTNAVEKQLRLETINNKGTMTHLEERNGQATIQPNTSEPPIDSSKQGK